MHALKYNWLQIKMPDSMLMDFLRLLRNRNWAFNVESHSYHNYYLISTEEEYISSRPVRIAGIPFKEFDQDLADAYSLIPTDEAKLIFVTALGDEHVV